MADEMDEEKKSIQKGARKGTIGTGAIIAIALVLLIVAGAAAYVFLAPKGGPGQPEIARIDGSSTVYPITSSWATEFNNDQRQVVVAFSGTSAGFQKFCRGETDLSDASRPIKQTEVDTCKAAGITATEFKVAYDALTVVVNPGNTWATSLTVKQLCRIWTINTSAGACGGAGPHVTNWNELDANWSNTAIKLYGPGTDSGTYDYWKEVILDPFKEKITDQFFASEDDNVLVQGVANDAGGLGYFGFAYYEENKNKVKAVAIDDEKGSEGPVLPSEAAIKAGTYKPLGRPIFVYAKDASLARQIVKDYLKFGFSTRGTELVAETGYVALEPAEVADEVKKIPP
jgi:phosphate transport system substrate-binding protein